jgi:signal peptidase I
MWWLVAPAQVGGMNSYVTTHGVSMEPRFHTGDLAVLRARGSYRVGDVAGYRSEMLHTIVMHRIVAERNGRYTFKGDNNSWIDPEKPTRDHLIGGLALRVPQGGVWLARISSPLGLSAAIFLLLATGGAVTGTRRRRRRQGGRPAMARDPLSGMRGMARRGRPQLIATAAGLLAVVGLGLGAAAWTGPVDVRQAAPQPIPPSMRFSYSAHVKRSAAYDGTTVASPDPVFRKVAKTVLVRYSYRGTPGTVAVSLDMSAPSGWHSTVPLSRPVRFSGDAYEGQVSLHMSALASRATAAATAIGAPEGEFSLVLHPQVRTRRGTEFRPALKLTMTPLQLELAGSPADLTVNGTAAPATFVSIPRTLGPAGWNVSVGLARVVSTVALLLALAAAVAAFVLARRATPPSEGTLIRRRYGQLLVEVRPLAALSEKPVVDVAEFATLAKLAARYGLLVLHWAENNAETFIVQDESVVYRYATVPSWVWPPAPPVAREPDQALT